MLRKVLAVIAGFALWSVLWVGGNALLPHAAASSAGASDAPASLPLALVLSVICSVASGAVAGAIMRRRPGAMRVAGILAAVLLLVGIAVEVSAWNSLPVWYHLTFLALLVPVTLVGGRLASGSRLTVTSS